MNVSQAHLWIIPTEGPLLPPEMKMSKAFIMQLCPPSCLFLTPPTDALSCSHTHEKPLAVVVLNL